MIKTIGDYPLVVGEIQRRNRSRAHRGFHKFLIKNRLYCEKCSELTPATDVVKDEQGHEIVVCDAHLKNE